MSARSRLALLFTYAFAMAYLEAAVVVYLRKLYYPENPLVIFPLRFMSEIDLLLELGRETATAVMILAVALLAEPRNGARSFAAFVYVFGVWDLFYYAWLKAQIGWPASWLEWDVLFLIPWIWLGPWIAPAAIALLFAVWGHLALASEDAPRFDGRATSLFALGSLLCLVTFLQPAVPVLVEGGVDALRTFEPEGFWWWLFVPGLALMGAGLALALRFRENLARRSR